jgi:hypothetical protein
MRMEELGALCREAARDLSRRERRPLPSAVVLPQPEASRVVTLPDFPPDDAARELVLERFAEQEMRPANAPCYGFVGEAEMAGPDGPVDVALVAYGARQQGVRVTAAPLSDEGVGEFLEDEPLDPHALPFLTPLQRAVDEAGPPDVTAIR